MARQRHGPKWFIDSLNPFQRSNLLLRQLVQYGDDCSGARAPLEALCQLVARLECEGCSMNIEDVFASECPGKDGDGPRAFIDAQHGGPDIMFSDVHRGRERAVGGAVGSFQCAQSALATAVRERGRGRRGGGSNAFSL